MEVHIKTKDELLSLFLKAALQKDKGGNAQILSWTLEDFTKKGSNFFVMVTCARVTYRLYGKELFETYIVKMMPVQPIKALREMLHHSCRKELLFYQDLKPALDAELSTVGLAPLNMPRSLHLSRDPQEMFLVMSDLRSLGFKRLKEKKCLDISHTKLILQELARLHASSVLLEANIGHINFDIKYSFLEKEWYNATSDARALFKTLLDGHVDNAIAILKTLEGDERAVRWLKKIKPDIYKIIQEQLQSDPIFTTLCHADCTSTNALFRYTDGSPVEVALLDFQQVRKASLVTDISLLLHVCLYGTDRKKNTHVLLQSYFSSFKNVMDAGKLQMPFTFNELFQEYQNKILFGALWAMSLIPLLIGGEGITTEMDLKDEDPHEIGKEFTANIKSPQERKRKNSSKIYKRESELRHRFIPIFDDLLEHGIIK